MIFTETKLKGSFVINVTPFTDERGWFARTYCKKEFEVTGFNEEWVQMNHSFTKNKGTIRGMHYQVPPFSEVKLVRCISGAVFDVIIDIREQSPTFLEWFGIELSAANRKMIFIPKGFAHGFQALTEDAELIYHHSQYYKPGVEGGIKFDDEQVGISWPLPVSLISERDLQHPLTNTNFKGITL